MSLFLAHFLYPADLQSFSCIFVFLSVIVCLWVNIFVCLSNCQFVPFLPYCFAPTDSLSLLEKRSTLTEYWNFPRKRKWIDWRVCKILTYSHTYKNSIIFSVTTSLRENAKSIRTLIIQSTDNDVDNKKYI